MGGSGLVGEDLPAMNRVEGHSPSASRWWVGLLVFALLACAAAAAVGWLREARARHALRLKEEDVARLEEAARSAERRLQQGQVAQDELERYRKQAEEVHRLRAQYQEWQRFKEEHTALKTDNERLRAALGGAAVASATTSPRGSWIGISLAQGPGGSGVVVQTLAPGGPAANSGLQAGDFIVAIDGTPVSTFQHVKDLIRAKPPGQAVVLDLSRRGTRLQVSVPAAPMPSFD